MFSFPLNPTHWTFFMNHLFFFFFLPSRLFTQFSLNTDEAFRFHHLDQTNVPGGGVGWSRVELYSHKPFYSIMLMIGALHCLTVRATLASPEPNFKAAIRKTHLFNISSDTYRLKYIYTYTYINVNAERVKRIWYFTALKGDA